MKNSTEYRKDADDYAFKMKYYFEESQKAWKNWNKAQAKEFSIKGNEYKSLLGEANTNFQASLQAEKEKKKNTQIDKCAVTNTVIINNFNDTFSNSQNSGEKEIDSRENIIETGQVYRNKSSFYAKKMQEAFEASQNAWKIGEKKKAKEYSDLGYKYREKMQIYNSNAIKLIATSNNYEREYDEIDLHGLYVKEALQFFIETVKLKLVSKSIEFLKVITGKGLHSPEGPKIKQKILEYCNENALIAFEDSTNEGCLVVSLF